MPLPALARVLGLTALAVAAIAAASCAESPEGGEAAPPLFTPGGEGVVGDGLCISTDCPPPWTSCPGERLCAVDLQRDMDHCGACGVRCPNGLGLRATSLCADGVCRLACDPFYGDCNGAVDDGCETRLDTDPANCGACGNACDEGVLCWRAGCGCPDGYVQCGQECRDIRSDDAHCGACDSPCTAPDPSDERWICGPSVRPPNTKWRCGDASCSLRCAPEYADCNDQFCGDGCETDITSDPNHCGACGNVCAAGQRCLGGTCLCPEGTTLCDGDCVNLLADVRHCGRCFNQCPYPASRTRSGGPECSSGRCGYVCFPGFADCDGRASNGCEANLQRDPNHCGACDARCPGGNAQPCVEGACLSKECDAGVVR